MKVQTEFFDKEFKKAIKDYQKAAGKDLPTVLNQVAVDLCFKAASKQKSVRKSKLNPHDPDNYAANKKKSHLMFALLNTKEGRRKGKGSTRKEKARSLYKIRQSSRGYIKAGFLAMAKKGGANVRINITPEMLADARFKKATPSSPIVYMRHGALGSTTLASKAMAAAIPAARANLLRRLDRKLAALAKRHSAR